MIFRLGFLPLTLLSSDLGSEIFFFLRVETHVFIDIYYLNRVYQKFYDFFLSIGIHGEDETLESLNFFPLKKFDVK